MVHFVATVDVGASSGRVMLAGFDANRRTLILREFHRFENCTHRHNGHDCWDFDHIHQEIVTGLTQIEAQGFALDSIGIDTWAVDFVLIDGAGRPLGPTVAYRDRRTDGMMEVVHRKISRESIYQRTGIQFQQFNTLYQLQALAIEQPAWLGEVEKLLLTPDYLNYLLCGSLACEYTNATATQLLNINSGTWDQTLLDCVGAPMSWFLPPVQPGSLVGHWLSPAGRQIKVIAPATHDTASAIAATPLADARTAYISSGTWSLMGLETRMPINGVESLRFNLTNEGGVEGTYCVLKNIMGLWLLQGVRNGLGGGSFADLVDAARRAPAGAFLVNPNDASFLNPPSMIGAIQDFCRRTGQGSPTSPGQLTRCVLESLALLYRQTKCELELVAGISIDLIQIIGGGSNITLLNQMTADFCRVSVATGPVEASALGNACYQLKGLGLLRDLNDVRDLVKSEFPIGRCEPAGDNGSIETLWQRFQDICRSKDVLPQPFTCESE